MSSTYWDTVLFHRITRRRAVAAAGAAAFLVACGGASKGLKFDDAGDARKPGTVWNAANDWRLEDETKDAVRGGIYRSFREEDQAGHYDAMVLAPSQVPMSGHIHEFLMGRNRGPGIDPTSQEAANPVPVLAESFELSGDGTTATFKLRQNVKWHPVAPVNGRVMDMDDVKTSLERFLASSPQRVPLTESFARAEYPDARTMVWKLNYPYAPLMARIWSERYAFPVMPKELNASPALAERTAVGTGYKILDKHQPSITMEYRKHAEYWAGEPFIDRWHQPIIPEYANRYAQFLNGGNIMDFKPTARDVLQLSKDAPQVVIVADPILDDQVSRIRFGRENHKTLPWKDVRVRIALRRAINFKGIGEFLANKKAFDSAGFPVEVASRTHLPHNLAYWLDPEKGELGPVSANYLFDIAEAKKLINAAGFSDAIEIQYTTLPASGQITEQEQLVMDSLGASGVFKVNVVRSANTVAHRNCRSLGQCDGLVQSSVSEDADHIIYRDYHSAGNTEGEQAYPDPRIDRVAEAQRRELDPQKRIELLKEFQRVAAELMPAIPYIHQYTDFRARWPWLHNTNYGSTQVNGEMAEGRPNWGGHKQWLDAAMPNRERGAS